MFIQFNLLPEVKKEYVKAKKTKRLIMVVSGVSSLLAIVVVVFLFSVVQIAQKGHVSRLSKDIEKYTSEIEKTDNLETILSVQNQQGLLTELHTKKPHTSRIFDYIAFFTPKGVNYDTLDYDGTTSHITITGSTDSLATVNTLVSNVKAVTYSIEGAGATQIAPYQNLSVQLSGDNDTASFILDLTFDPVIFDNTKSIVMKLADQTKTTKARIN